MVQSMTGFATKTFILETPDKNKSTITITIKSLNSRYFETHFKLPYPLSHLEHSIAKQMKKRLHRGTVYCTIYMSNPAVFKGKIKPDVLTITQYMHALTEIKNTCQFSNPIVLDNLLRLPNLFIEEEKAIDEQSLQTILTTIEELLTRVIDVRTEEGQSLYTDIRNRITHMQKEIAEIEKQAENVMNNQKEKIAQSLQEIGTEAHEQADSRRALLYTMLDKIDIHEEISRFKSHLKSLDSQLDTPTIDKGKRLDFTLQELAREINTIAAKCSDASISTHAINIKVEIEKAREQVQNLV